jgi:hypothetical protein
VIIMTSRERSTARANLKRSILKETVIFPSDRIVDDPWLGLAQRVLSVFQPATGGLGGWGARCVRKDLSRLTDNHRQRHQEYEDVEGLHDRTAAAPWRHSSSTDSRSTGGRSRNRRPRALEPSATLSLGLELRLAARPGTARSKRKPVTTEMMSLLARGIGETGQGRT